VIIDREKENKLFAALSALDFAPVYWGRFGNGRIEGWLDARPLVPEELAKTGKEGGREGEREGGVEVGMEGGVEGGKEGGGLDFVGMIAREMARMHALPVRMEEGEGGREGGREGGKAVLWEKMEEWARLARDISFVEDEGGREGGRGKQAQLEAIGLERLEEEMEWLKGQLLGEGGREGGRERARLFLREMVFSHQDLLCGNILYNPEWRREGGGEGGEGSSSSSTSTTSLSPKQANGQHDAAVSTHGGRGREGGRVQFIDFEYGGWNHRGFDLGNHFCEYAGFDPDYEKSYPSQEQQEWFFNAYLEGWRGREGGRQDEKGGEEEQGRGGEEGGREGGGEDEKEGEEEEFVQGLYVWVNRYACAAHLFWGYWAVIQAKYSPIEFDFLNYASQRLAGYEVFKKKYF
jgi:ethanolamine kinase